MEEYGHDEAKAQFSSDMKLFFGHIDEMQKSLNAFGLFLQKEKSINIRKSFEKFKDYFGLSVATINYTKYPTVKTEFQKIFKKSAVKRTKFNGLKRNIEFLK